MGTHKILPTKNIMFTMSNIVVLNIGILLNNIINIQVWKNDNLLIIDYFENGYNKVRKIPVYFYEDSKLSIVIKNNTLYIVVDDIDEYLVENCNINYETSYISVDTKYDNVYVDQCTNKNAIIITDDKIEDSVNINIF